MKIPLESYVQRGVFSSRKLPSFGVSDPNCYTSSGQFLTYVQTPIDLALLGDRMRFICLSMPLAKRNMRGL